MFKILKSKKFTYSSVCDVIFFVIFLDESKILDKIERRERIS